MGSNPIPSAASECFIIVNASRKSRKAYDHIELLPLKIASQFWYKFPPRKFERRNIGMVEVLDDSSETKTIKNSFDEERSHSGLVQWS